MRARRKLLRMSPYDAAGVETHTPEPMLLSQSNAHNPDGGFWCGRTSASIVWNYYKYVGGMRGELVKNQWEAPPYQLLYATGEPAALVDGSCKPAEVFDRLSRIHGKTWVNTPLYTQEARAAGKKPEEWLAPLLDHLDNNNPAFFASGISKTLKYCSHFVVITGYEYADDGSLWLQIHDPARNFSILQMLHGLDPKSAKKEEYESFLKIDQAGLWAGPGATVQPFGSIYRVRLDALLAPNPFIPSDVFGAHCSATPAPTPNLACDNSYRPFFSVMLTDSPLVTGESAFVLTELNLSWPIEPHSNEPARGGATPAESMVPEWEPWIDSRAPFPLGASLTWHGGVHVHRTSSSGDRLYSIGPGAIVLARFPKEKLDEASGTWTRDEPLPSSGFVLVRHRFDRQMRELIEHDRDEHVVAADPATKPAAPIELFGLVMHTAPISSYLEADPEQKPIQVGAQNAPAWLRPRLPRRLPAKRHWIPKGTPLSLAVFASTEDAAKGSFSALVPQFSTLPSDHEFTPSPKAIGGLKTETVDVDGAPRLPLPNPSYSSGHLALGDLQPLALKATATLGFFNPLTGRVVQAAPMSLAKGTAVVVAPSGDEVEVLASEGGQAWVRTRSHEHPGLVVSECAGLHRESGVVVVNGDSAELGIEHRGSYLPLRRVTQNDARLVFSCASAGEARLRPVLWPLVRVPKASVSTWAAQLASGRGEPPRATLADLVFYNPITEDVIDGQGGSEPTRPIDLKTRPGKTRTLSVVLERGGDVFLDTTDVTTCLDVADARFEQAPIVFFGPDQKVVRLYTTTAGEGEKRYFPDADAVKLGNAPGDGDVLAFRVAEQATTRGRDRIWPELVSCAKVPQATVDAWNAELRGSGGAREATRKRLAAGHTALFGAVLDGKSGWALDDAGRVVLQPDSGVTAELCAVAVQGGAARLSSLREGTAHSPFEVGSAASPIQPVGLVRDKAGSVVAAVFEVAKTLPADSPEGNDAERSKVAADNRAKWNELTGTLAQGALVDLQAEPVRVTREQVALADPAGAFAHVELFSEQNVVADVDGSDEKLVHASKTPFWVFRDDDAVDTYSADFVEKMREALAEARAAIRIDERALYAADREGGVIKPSEWIEYCRANQRMFSFIIPVTKSEWHPDHAGVLDEAKRRGAHLPEEELERTKAEMARLAFLDALHADARTYFHYHPLRFVEWLLTGVDVEIKGAKAPEVMIGPRGGVGIDAKTSRPTFFRYRTTVGDAQPHLHGVVTLGGDIGTKNDKIPVLVERGRIQRLTIVKPYVVCRVSPMEKLDVDLAYHVSYAGGSGATYLLADHGESPHGTTLGTVTYEIEVGWNLVGPTKVEARLTGDVADFEIVAVRAPAGAAVARLPTSFAVTWERERETAPFRASKAEVVQVDVIARGTSDKSAHLEVSAEGGDLGSLRTKSADVKTRTIASKCDDAWHALTIGEDVAELQLYLSQILASDEKPCFGHRDADAAVNLGLSGRYDKRTAIGVWRFLYSYANDPQEALDIGDVPVTDIRGNADKRTPATLASLRDPDDAVKAKRCGNECNDYPKIDGKLAAQIAKRFKPPHVLPLMKLDVATRTAAFAGGGPHAGALAMDLGTNCGSMILPDGDGIELVASAPGMQSLKGTLDVVVEVPGASAYALSGPARHTLTSSRSSFRIELVPSGKLTVAPVNNKLVVKATNGAVLASIVLGGARDLLASKARDGVDRRDAFLIQAWLHGVIAPHPAPLLIADPYYAPRQGALLDGKWGEIQHAALKRFAQDHGATSWADAVHKLRVAAQQSAPESAATPWMPYAR